VAKSTLSKFGIIQITLTPEEEQTFVGFEMAFEQTFDAMDALCKAGNSVTIKYDPERETYSALVRCIDPDSPNFEKMFYANAEVIEMALFLAWFKWSLVMPLGEWGSRLGTTRKRFS